MTSCWTPTVALSLGSDEFARFDDLKITLVNVDNMYPSKPLRATECVQNYSLFFTFAIKRSIL